MHKGGGPKRRSPPAPSYTLSVVRFARRIALTVTEPGALFRDATRCRFDEDARSLARLLSPQDLRRHYVQAFEAGEQGTMAEAFAVARASTFALSLEPHVAIQSGRNYDARLTFRAADVGIEVKHQRYRFPFDRQGIKVDEGIELHIGSRPGADPRVLDMSRPDTTHSLPGSSVWRETLLDAAHQLPRDLPGIVALSVDAFGDFATDVEDALYGDLTVETRPNSLGVGSARSIARLGNGVFAQADFRHVSAVWFFRLRLVDEPVLLCDWALHAENPRRTRDLPAECAICLPSVPGSTDEYLSLDDTAT